MSIAMTLEENEVQEEAAFARTDAIEQRAKELAAQWMAEDALEFLQYIDKDSFSPTESDLLGRWLTAPAGEASTARLDESAGLILRKFVNDYALGRGMRIADSTRGLMDTYFQTKIGRL